MPRPAKEHTEKMVSIKVPLTVYTYIKKKAKWGESLGSVLERVLRVRGKLDETSDAVAKEDNEKTPTLV